MTNEKYVTFGKQAAYIGAKALTGIAFTAHIASHAVPAALVYFSPEAAQLAEAIPMHNCELHHLPAQAEPVQSNYLQSIIVHPLAQVAAWSFLPMVVCEEFKHRKDGRTINEQASMIVAKDEKILSLEQKLEEQNISTLQDNNIVELATVIKGQG